jgi:hypothetical protein
VQAFRAAGKPVFGICRGLQLINVAHGGTLYQDISTQKPGARRHRDAAAYDLNFHEVDILPRTRLAQLLPPGRHKVNSVHHQGVKDLAPGFVVEAVSPDDGVIEAIRHTGDAWVAAVQWHPEFHRPELGRDRRHPAAAGLPGGRPRGPLRMNTLKIRNPASGELVIALPADDARSVAVKATAARAAQPAWAAWPLADRLACLRRSVPAWSRSSTRWPRS